ncbi:MAG: hypothetical protein MUF72_20685 [Elainella sp. Prado103]|nr:hypothetical protein [Elainella sp. Prado103]
MRLVPCEPIAPLFVYVIVNLLIVDWLIALSFASELWVNDHVSLESIF